MWGFHHFLFWNVYTFYLIDLGVPKMVFLVFLLGGIWRGVLWHFPSPPSLLLSFLPSFFPSFIISFIISFLPSFLSACLPFLFFSCPSFFFLYLLPAILTLLFFAFPPRKILLPFTPFTYFPPRVFHFFLFSFVFLSLFPLFAASSLSSFRFRQSPIWSRLFEIVGKRGKSLFFHYFIRCKPPRCTDSRISSVYPPTHNFQRNFLSFPYAFYAIFLAFWCVLSSLEEDASVRRSVRVCSSTHSREMQYLGNARASLKGRLMIKLERVNDISGSVQPWACSYCS